MTVPERFNSTSVPLALHPWTPVPRVLCPVCDGAGVVTAPPGSLVLASTCSRCNGRGTIAGSV